MRITNIKPIYEGLKKGIKYMLCYISLGTMLSMPVSGSAENTKSNAKFQSKNVQTVDWNMEANYFPMGKVLYTGDYMEKSYTVYSKDEKIDSDDLVITVTTNSVIDEKSGLYLKTRYRLRLCGVKAGELTEDEIDFKSKEALINIINGFDLEDVEVLSKEEIIVKSLDEIEEVDLNEINSKEDYPTSTSVPVESVPSNSKNFSLHNIVLALVALGCAVWMASDIINGDLNSAKYEEKRYRKRIKHK